MLFFVFFYCLAAEDETDILSRNVGTDCLETSVRKYHSTLRKIPKERRSRNWSVQRRVCPSATLRHKSLWTGLCSNTGLRSKSPAVGCIVCCVGKYRVSECQSSWYVGYHCLSWGSLVEVCRRFGFRVLVGARDFCLFKTIQPSSGPLSLVFSGHRGKEAGASGWSLTYI
jgi:hypothetical protein